MRRWHTGLGFAIALLIGLWITSQLRDSERAPTTQSSATDTRPAPASGEEDVASGEKLAGPAAGKSAGPSDRGILRGRVIDAATHAPLRTFRIGFPAVTSANPGAVEPPPSRTFTAADGRFEWTDIRAGRWTITVRAEGYQQLVLGSLEIAANEATAEHVFPLRPGHTLRGRVYDEATGAGIAAARLSFRDFGTDRFENFRSRPQALSAKDGSFVLDGVPPGRIVLSVSADEYAYHERTVSGTDTSSIDIALPAGGTISGRLTAADGVTPVAGLFEAWNLDRHYGSKAPTDANGEFVRRHLESGRYRLTGEAGALSVSTEVVLRHNGRIEGLVLALAPGRTVRGYVRGLLPKERARTLVRFYSDVSMRDHQQVPVDDQGAYVIEGVSPGRATLQAETGTRNLQKPVIVPENADLTVDFEFPPGFRLSGRVTRGGAPLASVNVIASAVGDAGLHAATVTSASGRYAIEGLAPGDYFVAIGGSRRYGRRIALSGDAVVDLELPGGALSGRVVETDGLVPIEGATVEIIPATGSVPRDGAGFPVKQSPDPVRHVRTAARTDGLGAFSLTGLLPGDFVITAYKPGYEMLRQPLTLDESSPDLTLRLARDEGVELHAHDEMTGAPLASLFVLQKLETGNGSWIMLDLDEGAGSLPRSLTGSPLVFTSSEGHVPLEIASWDGTPLDLLFVPTPAENERRSQ